MNMISSLFTAYALYIPNSVSNNLVIGPFHWNSVRVQVFEALERNSPHAAAASGESQFIEKPH